MVSAFQQLWEQGERCPGIVSGAAGSLLLARSSPPSNAAEDLAHAAATRLKALALWDHDRASWASDLAQGELLVGFSHGTSGIAVGFREQIQLHQGFVPQSALDGAIPETYPRRRMTSETLGQSIFEDGCE